MSMREQSILTVISHGLTIFRQEFGTDPRQAFQFYFGSYEKKATSALDARFNSDPTTTLDTGLHNVVTAHVVRPYSGIQGTVPHGESVPECASFIAEVSSTAVFNEDLRVIMAPERPEGDMPGLNFGLACRSLRRAVRPEGR